MVPQHGPFSLHTMLEDPLLHIMAFPTPMVRPLDESQGSSPLQGHGSWLMCKVTLSRFEHGDSSKVIASDTQTPLVSIFEGLYGYL
jgi:hypothetical protein